MTREKAISILQIIGAELSVDLGLEELLVGEDRQKGIWGEQFTEWLENKYGKCTESIKWIDKNDADRKVELRFRFATPCLSIKTGNAFAEIEVSNYNRESKEFDLPYFRISQTTVFNYDEGGSELLNLLHEKWSMKVNKESYLSGKATSLLSEIFSMLPKEPRSDYPDDDPGFWSDGDKILCPSSTEAEIVADFIEDVVSEYGAINAVTGYFDPAEDRKSNTIDKMTGFHYVDF